jgi:uncharacterized RDD family membrane protein YckC
VCGRERGFVEPVPWEVERAMTCVNHASVTAGLLRCQRCQQTFCRNCLVALRGFFYCADCKGQQVRDIQSGTEAGVLELASVGRRFAAMWLDGMLQGFVIAVPVLLVIFLGASAGPTDPQQFEKTMGLVMIPLMFALVAMMVVYEGLMLASRGQTLGKMAVGIKVVTPEGNDISTGQAWGRAALRQVFFSYFAAINYLPAFFTKQKTAIHDLACKTRVVRSRR